MPNASSGIRTSRNLHDGNGIVQVIPYVEVDGNKTVSDSHLSLMYDQIVEDGLLDVVFFSGSVRTVNEFIAFVKSPGNYVGFCLVNNEVMGMAWLNGLSDNYATGHFCFFKKSWKKYTEDMGHAFLDYWFSWPGENGPLFDTLLGLVPDFNRRAIAFVKKLGFKELGPVPNMFKTMTGRAAMVVLYKTR